MPTQASAGSELSPAAVVCAVPGTSVHNCAAASYRCVYCPPALRSNRPPSGLRPGACPRFDKAAARTPPHPGSAADAGGAFPCPAPGAGLAEVQCRSSADGPARNCPFPGSPALERMRRHAHSPGRVARGAGRDAGPGQHPRATYRTISGRNELSMQ